MNLPHLPATLKHPGWIALALLAVMLGIGGVLWWRHLHAWPDGLILVNGRIEGDRYIVAAKVPGRVRDVLVHEDDNVHAGDVLVRLDDAEIAARVDQAEHGVAALQAQWKGAQQALDVAQQEVPLSIASAQASLANARATLVKAEAAENQAERDVTRMRSLERDGAIETRRREEAELLWNTRHADRLSAAAGVTVAERQLADARLGPSRIIAKRDDVAALQAQIERTQAALTEARSVEADLQVRAPVSGVVSTRIAEPGVVNAAGAPLLELVDLDKLYLTAYVPAVEIGKLRRHLEARVFIDAFPGRAFAAHVDYIASRAEFTPKEVQTQDERVKEVYRVKLYLDTNPDHLLTPGIPADAVIRWDSRVAWREPSW